MRYRVPNSRSVPNPTVAHHFQLQGRYHWRAHSRVQPHAERQEQPPVHGCSFPQQGPCGRRLSGRRVLILATCRPPAPFGPRTQEPLVAGTCSSATSWRRPARTTFQRPVAQLSGPTRIEISPSTCTRLSWNSKGSGSKRGSAWRRGSPSFAPLFARGPHCSYVSDLMPLDAPATLSKVPFLTPRHDAGALRGHPWSAPGQH